MDKLTNEMVTVKTDKFLCEAETRSQWKKNCRTGKQERKGRVMKFGTRDVFIMACIV